MSLVIKYTDSTYHTEVLRLMKEFYKKVKLNVDSLKAKCIRFSPEITIDAEEMDFLVKEIEKKDIMDYNNLIQNKKIFKPLAYDKIKEVKYEPENIKVFRD